MNQLETETKHPAGRYRFRCAFVMPIICPDYPFQGHFIGVEGSRVKEIIQACSMGEFKDPYIFLTDVKLQLNPEEEMKSSRFAATGVASQLS